MRTLVMFFSFLGGLALPQTAFSGEARPDDLDAQAAGDAKVALPDLQPAPSRWRFGASAGVVVGVDAEFSRLGEWASPNAPVFGSSGIDRTYDDGFNDVDSSGNAGNQTWNWGYIDDAQYDAGAGTLDLSTYESLRNASVEDSDDPQFAFNLFALYDMGAVDAIKMGGRASRWGFKAGLGYQRISIGNRTALSSDLLRRTDTFDLEGVIPPLAPYSGSFAGPGPLLSDVGIFSEQTLGGGATVVGSRDVDADLFLLSFGPYWEFLVNEKLSLFAEGGVNFGVAHGNYSFESATTIPGIGTQTTTGDESSNEFLGGVYLGAGISYALNEEWSLYADAKYQYIDPISFGANGSQAELDFDSAFVFSLGALYRF